MTNYQTFYFHPDKQCWGHRMYASTFRFVEPRIIKRKWFRKPLTIPRVSVMVHCQNPQEGDLVVYQNQKGIFKEYVIVDIDRCYNVDDMFTLTMEPVTNENFKRKDITISPVND